MTNLNTSRHQEVFSADVFGDRRIDVIGAGASGSRVVLSLAKLGLQNIHVWDFDVVEAHNVPNQAYGIKDVGAKKVSALAALVLAQTGITITPHDERVDGSQTLADVVFLLTDTMSSRKQIWDKAIKYKKRTALMIETRMGSDQGRIYSINPIRPAEVRGWEATLCDDGLAEVSACGTTISVGPTAEIISGLAVWQLIRWLSIQNGNPKADSLEHELIFTLRGLDTMKRSF